MGSEAPHPLFYPYFFPIPRISAFPLGWPWEAQSSPRVARDGEHRCGPPWVRPDYTCGVSEGQQTGDKNKGAIVVQRGPEGVLEQGPLPPTWRRWRPGPSQTPTASALPAGSAQPSSPHASSSSPCISPWPSTSLGHRPGPPLSIALSHRPGPQSLSAITLALHCSRSPPRPSIVRRSRSPPWPSVTQLPAWWSLLGSDRIGSAVVGDGIPAQQCVCPAREPLCL